MRINLIFDLEQYKWVLVPILEELASRGHTPIVSYTREDTREGVDASLAVQDVAYSNIPKTRTRFFINHGVSATKGWDLPMDIDYFIGQSDYWADTLLKKMKHYKFQYNVIRGTGWPKMDLLHQFKRDASAIKTNIYTHLGLDANKKLVLCFPTYKKNRNEHKPWERDVPYYRIYEELRKDHNVFVFPHQMDDTQEFEYIHDPNRVLRINDIRRLHFQAAADLIVSDASGIAYEACGTDTPVVLLNSEGHVTTLENRKNGEVVDMGPWVSVPEIGKTVKEQLGNPGMYAERRAYWSDKILGPVDGNVAKRVVDEMEKVVP